MSGSRPWELSQLRGQADKEELPNCSRAFFRCEAVRSFSAPAEDKQSEPESTENTAVTTSRGETDFSFISLLKQDNKLQREKVSVDSSALSITTETLSFNLTDLSYRSIISGTN